MAPARRKGATKAKTTAKFRPGDLVLAKVLGFPPWPAKVSRPEDWERVPDSNKYFVQFFGTQELAFVATSDVQVFTSESKGKLVARCRGKTVKYFAQAVKEVCEALEELEKSDLNGPGHDATLPGHDASNVGRNADGSHTEWSRKFEYVELCGSEASNEDLVNRAAIAEKFVKSSSHCKIFEKVEEIGGNIPTEASVHGSVVSSTLKEETGLVGIKADTVGHCERIESSKACSFSPYISCSDVKHVTSQHGDGKKDSPMSLGAVGNLKSPVGDKKSANEYKSVELIVGSKRKVGGAIHHKDETRSGLFITDQIPQKPVAQVKRRAAGLTMSKLDSHGKVLQGPLKNEKFLNVTKCTSQNAISAPKECGEGGYPKGEAQSLSNADMGSRSNSEKSDLEPTIHDEEGVRSFGHQTVKNDTPKNRRAVCLYNDDDDDYDASKNNVHGGSVAAYKIGLSSICPDSWENNENHDNPSCTGETHKDGIGFPNDYELKLDDSPKAQVSQSPRKEETNKRQVKEAKMDVLFPALSPLVAVAAKKLFDQQKPTRTSSKPTIVKSYTVHIKDSKSVFSGSNNSQKSRGPLSGERAKGVSRVPSNLNEPAFSLSNQKDHDSALGKGRVEDDKDRSSSLVVSKALDSAMSMKQLIAAAQAKRQQALIQTAPEGNGNSVPVSTSNVHVKSSSPILISMGHDISSGIVTVTENDAQGVHPRESCTSPHVHILQLDSKEPEDKRPGSEHQTAGSTLSGGTEAAVARDAFEGMIETLSRTRESIGRATRLAIDCAKYGIANEVVELLIHKLENETIIQRRVDLFFLVDSITQCSHSQKGIAGASYIPIVQAALPRLLVAAAPSGTSSRENRRQCLKVLRLWLERKIFPKSVLRRFMNDIGSSNDDMSSGLNFRRPSRAERSMDDPIREMEGMLVDEYGSNSTFNFPGFLSSHGFVDDDNEEEDDDPNIASKETDASPLQPSNNSGVPETGTVTPNDMCRHILGEVDGELEIEDMSGNLKDGTPRSLSKDRSEMLFVTKLENSVNDVVESPLEGSPPLPLESPPPFPPLPTSPPPPFPPLSPSPPPPPPPPPMLPSQGFMPSLASSGSPHVGNLPSLLPLQPSMASEAFLHPTPGFPSVQASVDYLPTGNHADQVAWNTPQQVSCFPTGPSSALDTSGYSSVYGGPQAGYSNQHLQHSQQLQPCKVMLIPRAFPPVTVPQPPSDYLSYNNPTLQQPMSQSQPHLPPPVATSHPFSSASYSDNLRRVGDEQWRSASAENKLDTHYNSWVMNAGRMTSCLPTNFLGEAYFRPLEIALTDSMRFQVPAMAVPAPSDRGINQMLPSRPDMSSLNHWRPV